MTMTFPILGLIIIFAGIFAAGKLAEMNSPVIDGLAWILGILLFVFIILATLHF
jgi:hypothetical protein